MSDSLQRLFKNRGGYLGERIDAGLVLRELLDEARRHRWEIERLPAATGIELVALRRTVPQSRRRIYISSGIHGDEPAGPLAVLHLLKEDPWPADADIWLCPWLNPVGLARNTRENGEGIDLNLDYRDPKSSEVQAHIRWLERQPAFDTTLCLHEDWESHGFYVYERRPQSGEPLAERIVKAVSRVCPIDTSQEIDGWPAKGGVITPNIDPEVRPLWAEAVYLSTHKSDRGCTLEAPSDFPLSVRVAALVTGVTAVFR